MKKVLIALMSVALLGGMSSCNKWLDVDADTRVGENVMFETGAGMRIALNGIYSSLSEKSMYGQELTWGLASVLSRDYLNSQLPIDYKDNNLIHKTNGWKESYTTKIIDPVWGKAYNTLANINNLLQAVEKTEESFFEQGKLERNMFLAELRGIRALIHFELLRLFAPAPIKDDGKAYIPYVEKYPEYQPTKLTVSQTMDKIEADLQYAADLLIDIDTAAGDGYALTTGIHTGNNRLRHDQMYAYTESRGEWFSMRGYRMNFYAVQALLMRLYMWEGELDKVIETSKYFQHKKWWRIENLKTYSQVPNSSTTKLWNDILFAGYNPEMKNMFDKASVVSNQKKFRYETAYFNGLYTEDKDDYRGKLMSGTANDNRSLRWLYETETFETRIIPVIRLSEVYLMLVEAYAETDFEKAVTMLYDYRRIARNAKRVLNFNSKAELTEFLKREWAREFQSEGQKFFFNKRHGFKVYQGEGKAEYDFDANKCWVLPQPLNEDSYRL